MSYWEFLARWYNLVFLALVAGGLAVGLAGRLAARRRPGVAAGLIVAGIVGLTWNGALHDLGLHDYERRFSAVLAVSLVIGTLVGLAVARVRRWRPGVQGLAFTAPGLEGTRARVVSGEVGADPASGRVQWTDAGGVMYVVRVHTSEPSMRFGREVVLRDYDPNARSYRVESAGDET